MTQETFIIGNSEGMEAEYSERADAPVAVIGFYEGQSFVCYGAQTIAEAKVELLANGATQSRIGYI